MAKPATTSSTRGNSRTESACEFTMPRNGKTRSRDGRRRPGCLRLEVHRHPRFASSSRAMALIVPPSARPLNCGITLPITAPTLVAPPAIAATTAARMLVVAHRRREILAEQPRLPRARLLARSARPPVVHLDRLAPALDALAQHVDHVVVREIAPQLDLPILGVGDDRAEQSEHCGLVLRSCARRSGRPAGVRAWSSHLGVSRATFLRTAAFIFRFRRSLGFS